MMEEDETFDEFYAKLKDIVNSAFNLGESIVEPKIVKKILRSLFERFHANITVTEWAKDIDKISLNKLVGNLQTYEMGLGKIGKGGKSRSMALKDIEEESDDFEDEAKDEDENEDLTFIAKKIRKLFQYRKKDKNKAPKKSDSFRKGKSEKNPYLVPWV